MKNCIIQIPFAGDPATLLNKAQKAALQYGASFNGDLGGGNFEFSAAGGKFKGTYLLIGSILEIRISKPFFIPCSTIRSLLQAQIN
jgi:hypothetical protein